MSKANQWDVMGFNERANNPELFERPEICKQPETEKVYETENYVDETTNRKFQRVTVVEKKLADRYKGLKPEDFSLENLIETGAINDLKYTNLSNSNLEFNIEGIANQLENISEE